MDAHLQKLAAAQSDVVAAWQLRQAGWSWKQVEHHGHRGGWRTVHRGVFLLAHAPPSRRQLWLAAALSAPDSALSHGSGGACYGFHLFERGYEVVTRPGDGGRRRHGALLVCRSNCLHGEVTHFMGIPITTAERVLIDLSAGLSERRLGRAFREAIRLKRTTVPRLLDALERHRGRRGIAALGALATRYAGIPYHRTRSDAEGQALEVLHDGGRDAPKVNTKVAGVEADLAWPERKLIVEIDGPQYHQFPDEDARKELAWRGAGFTVRRIGSDEVYDEPESLMALVD